MNHKDLYTPAQFASMFNIDRQTLIYYDNANIFSPCYRNKNGYRFYSSQQIFDFVTLQSLRHLKIQGAFLREYMHDLTTGMLSEILHDKIDEYEKESSRLMLKANYLKKVINRLSSRPTIYNQPLLLQKDKLYYQRSRLFTGETTLSEAFLRSAPLLKIYGDYELMKNLHLSIESPWMNSNSTNLQDYRLILTAKESDLFSSPLVLKSGLYVLLNLKINSDVHQTRNIGIQIVRDFIGINHLNPQNVLFQTFIYSGNNINELRQPYLRLEVPVNIIQ